MATMTHAGVTYEVPDVTTLLQKEQRLIKDLIGTPLDEITSSFERAAAMFAVAVWRNNSRWTAEAVRRFVDDQPTLKIEWEGDDEEDEDDPPAAAGEESPTPASSDGSISTPELSPDTDLE